MATTTNLNSLVINYLTQEQYDEAQQAGTLNANQLYLTPDTGNTYGTVTSIGIANATNGGLSISGSPVTSSGSITVGHSNVLSSAQTTQAVYPIKIDKNGHISAYGNAVTIPSAGTTASAVSTSSSGGSATTWSKSDHVHSITGATVKSALGTGSGTTKFLREDGTWATPAYIANTDYHVRQTPLSDTTTRMLLLSDHAPSNNGEHDGTSYTSSYLCFLPSTGSLSLGTSNSVKAEIGPTYVRLAGQNTSVYKITLKTPEISGADTLLQVVLPDKSGTLALTSDIPSVYSSTNTGGYLTMATLPIYDGTVV